MLKGRFDIDGGGLLILLGLTDKNIETLRQGKPLSINAESDFGLTGVKIVVAQGKDEAEIKAWLQNYFNLVDKDAATRLIDLPEPN